MTSDRRAGDQAFPPPWLLAALSRLESLTERQQAVMVLLGLGLDNAMIAQRLRCSERTVKQHISAIFLRLG
ncbi:MAG TPA: helix-turn-helix transcriptional regulator, partial [Streptosporangiaceae bacterium]